MKRVKAWASIDHNGDILFPCSSRLHKSINGKYRWYKYTVISDKKCGVVRQNGYPKAIRVEIREVKP